MGRQFALIYGRMTFEFASVLNKKIIEFWDVNPYYLVEKYERFVDTFYLLILVKESNILA
jgi:hypothetical protein